MGEGNRETEQYKNEETKFLSFFYKLSFQGELFLPSLSYNFLKINFLFLILTKAYIF